MSKRIKYSDEPIRAEVIADFLPSPEQLVVGEEGVKVTIPSVSEAWISLKKLQSVITPPTKG